MTPAVPPHQLPVGMPTDPRIRMAVVPQLRSWVLWPAIMAAFVLTLGFSAKFIPGFTPGELVVDQEISRRP